MLEKLQQGGQHIILKIILGLIIVSFALAGIGSYLSAPRADYAAKVNGEPISQGELEQAFQNQRNQMQRQYGDAFSAMANNSQYMAQLKRSVLEQLIQQRLILQEAKALGLTISNDQIKQEIKQMPAFQKNGSFDNATFRQILANAGLTPDRFSRLTRQDLLSEQLRMALFDSQFVLPTEVNRLAAIETQERSFDYVAIPDGKFEGAVKPTDEELKAYYQTHQKNFRSQETVDVNYILVDAKKLAKTITVSDDKARQYLQEHAAQYSQPEQRKAAHILITVKNGDDAAAKAKAESILKQLNDGADFSKLAKADSDDKLTAKNGGELDWFQKGVMPEAFDEAVFALKQKGDISQVVKTKYGYHIIKLLGERPAELTKFASVKDDIVKHIQQDEAMNRFYDLSNKLSDLSFEMPDSLDGVAKLMGVSVEHAKSVTHGKLPKEINVPKVVQQIFSQDAIEQQQNSNVINLSPEQALVIRVTAHQDAAVKPFEQVSDEVHQAVVAEKAHKASEDYAKELKQAAGDNAKFKQLLNAKGLKLEHAANVSRLKDAKLDPQLVRDVYKLPQPKDKASSVETVKVDSGSTYVVRLTAVTQPQIDEQLKQQLKSQLENQSKNQSYQILLNYLRSHADISYHG